ncbi:MAG TPA: PEP-CTERM sorting domain-containing protein [Candidatus Acidoferrum sp.]|nr:PEP-CTERM sorting domain-containing protein [Candidatus Acidoferrum sp.]
MQYSIKSNAGALLGLFLALGSLSQGRAQNVLADSTISGTEIGTSGTYDYTLTLTALTGSAPIQSYWFAWTPGNFFLQSTPTSITGNDGWTGIGNGGSIEFVGGTAITPGNTVTFNFDSTITPSQMNTDVGPPSSVVYPGAINFSGSSPNETIGVESVPEPSVTVLFALGAAVLGYGVWRKRSSSVLQPAARS